MDRQEMTFEEFWKMFYEEAGEDVWNMSLERYNALKAQALAIYKEFIA